MKQIYIFISLTCLVMPVTAVCMDKDALTMAEAEALVAELNAQQELQQPLLLTDAIGVDFGGATNEEDDDTTTERDGLLAAATKDDDDDDELEEMFDIDLGGGGKKKSNSSTSTTTSSGSTPKSWKIKCLLL